MDTRTAASDPAQAQVATIKAYMPGVLAAIRAKEAEIGGEAYALVRRGARGEPDCFYAFEGGRVVGTPFCHAVSAEVAAHMVTFGATFLVMWPEVKKESADGTH